MTLIEHAIEHNLTRLATLPVGRSVVLRDPTGHGGLLIKRTNRHTLLFQRTDFQHSRRWANGNTEAREILRAHVSGRLRNEGR